MTEGRHGRTGRGDDLWIVNHYAVAPDAPGGTRHFDLAKALVARGLRVTIFAAGISHTTGEETRIPRWQLFAAERHEGVRFVWIRTLPYRGNTWRRPLNMLSFAAAFLVVQLRWPAPRVLIGSTVHPFAALAAWVASSTRGSTFMFEVRDLWPQTLVDLGAMRVGSPTERILRALEAFLVRRASAVITLLPGMRDYLVERGLPDLVTYIPNGVDPEAFGNAVPTRRDDSGPLAACLDAIGELRANQRLVFGYLGAFGRVNRVDVIAQAVAIAEERSPGRIGVVLVGDGPERPEIERRFGATSSLILCPAVPKRDVPAVLQALDATVVHTTATPVYRYGVSFNKLFEYMAAAKPVVFACASAYDPVATVGAGLSVRPDDPGALAEAFLALSALGIAERTTMGLRARDYVLREHNMASLGATLAALIENVS